MFVLRKLATFGRQVWKRLAEHRLEALCYVQTMINHRLCEAPGSHATQDLLLKLGVRGASSRLERVKEERGMLADRCGGGERLFECLAGRKRCKRAFVCE
jgi:hypothetical protein